MPTSEELKDMATESLVYERAFSRISRIAYSFVHELNKAKTEAETTGVPMDESYQVVMDDLNALKKKYRARSDELWNTVDREADRDDNGFERLSNAILQNVAEDYETALCGSRSVNEIKRIEDFAKNGAEQFTELDFSKVLQRIRRMQPKFVDYAEKHGPEIHSWTRESRKNDYPSNDRKNPHRCPLCGGGMYTYGKVDRGTAVVKCTGCCLFARVKVVNDDDKG